MPIHIDDKNDDLYELTALG